MRRLTWTLVVRLAVGGVFTAAALGKLLDTSSGFVTPQLLGPAHPLFAPFLALERVLPWLELLVAASLAAGCGVLAAAATGAALSAVFVAFAVALPPGARCHCFGLLGGFGTRAAHASVTVALLVANLAVAWGAWRGTRARRSAAASCVARADAFATAVVQGSRP
jgi:hypothetical protein